MSKPTIHRPMLAALSAAIAAAFVQPGFAQSGKSPKTPLDQIHERIANKLVRQKVILGKPAPAGAYPFQVSMIDAGTPGGQEFDGHFCGATFISPTWILTAAHCVTENGKVASPKAIEVYAGSQNFKNGERIPLKSIFRHPNYLDNFFENDIALLQLARAPKAGTKFQQINLIDLANEGTLAAPGTTVTVMGWGTTERDQGAETLQHATVKLVDRSECNRNLLVKRTRDLEEDLEAIERRFRIPKDKLSNVREAIVGA